MMSFGKGEHRAVLKKIFSKKSAEKELIYESFVPWSGHDSDDDSQGKSDSEEEIIIEEGGLFDLRGDSEEEFVMIENVKPVTEVTFEEIHCEGTLGLNGLEFREVKEDFNFVLV